MTLDLLDHFLMAQLSAFLLIFCRAGAAIMVLPGFGDAYVSPRIRLLFALALSLVVTPVLMDAMPPLPKQPLALGILLIEEVITGAFIGSISRIILSALHTAGTVIAYQSSLAVSSIFDPVTGAQTAVLSNFLTIAITTLVFALNLHHLMIAAIVESYQVFKPGNGLMVADMFQFNARLLSDSFALGILLSGPHIILSVLFFIMGGLMSRLMPNFQIFMISMSPQILLAYLLLFAILPTLSQVFTEFMHGRLVMFVGEP